MDADCLRIAHEKYLMGDLELLEFLQEVCDEEDKAEVDYLIYLNDTVGIGWGVPSEPEYKDVFREKEDEYFDRKRQLLKKYNSLESWQEC